jgi:hypothetical protein
LIKERLEYMADINLIYLHNHFVVQFLNEISFDKTCIYQYKRNDNKCQRLYQYKVYSTNLKKKI